MARAIQPDLVINNRTGHPGDYDTPEQRIGGFQIDRPWETCMTICQQWAWKPDDRMKSLEECLHTLLRTAGGDGNLLFNVGPMPGRRDRAAPGGTTQGNGRLAREKRRGRLWHPRRPVETLQPHRQHPQGRQDLSPCAQGGRSPRCPCSAKVLSPIKGGSTAGMTVTFEIPVDPWPMRSIPSSN
jgi:hypothetical protein